MNPFKNIYFLLLISAVCILFIFTTQKADAQWYSDKTADFHIEKGVNYIYNLQFDSAQHHFQKVINIDPEHPSGHFFMAMVYWWKIMLDLNNESLDKILYEKLRIVIDKCDKILKKDQDDLASLFFKGGAIGFRGRLRVHREEWLYAANDGRLAIPIVQRAYKIDPSNMDVLLGIGIYNYYRDVIPDLYPFVKPVVILFPSGDKEKGLNQLKIAAEKGKYANYEATYFLMQTLFHFEKQYSQALPLALKLYNKFPDNPIFHRYVGRLNVALGRWEDLKTIFTDIVERANQKKYGYSGFVSREAYYYLGIYYMNFNKSEQALENFYRCDELSRTLDKKGPSVFMVMANLKIGMIYDLQNRRDLAILQYNKVLKLKSQENSRDIAKKYLKKPYGKF